LRAAVRHILNVRDWLSSSPLQGGKQHEDRDTNHSSDDRANVLCLRIQFERWQHAPAVLPNSMLWRQLTESFEHASFMDL